VQEQRGEAATRRRPRGEGVGHGRDGCYAPTPGPCSSEGERRERRNTEMREKRGKWADMWVPLPHVIYVSETTFQNSRMVKYERF